MNWAYAVTTVPERLLTTLPGTLRSLTKAGFENPWVSIDGRPTDQGMMHYVQRHEYNYSSLPIRAFGHWQLTLFSLFIRNPDADRYVIFQDDVRSSLGLRDYLTTCRIPAKSYQNLITYPINHETWPFPSFLGWHRSNQEGKGGQGLVLPNEAVQHLLTDPGFMLRSQDRSVTKKGRIRSHSNIDGAVCNSLTKRGGWVEYVHTPSPLSHLSEVTSAIGNKTQPTIESWRGEEFDLRSLLSR